ncbi:MAG: dihydroneopterin aldolase [Muribaculaceae bacterium]|nr:dihydroneopterin aldolase [Muribaculaceae bacterium]
MATGIIEVNKLRLQAYHGVLEQERVSGNVFEVTVHLRYSIDNAMQTDNVTSTLDYSEIVEIVKNVMKVPSNLLEHVIGRLKGALIQRYPVIQGGMISIAKLTPPISCEVESVAVSYRW